MAFEQDFPRPRENVMTVGNFHVSCRPDIYSDSYLCHFYKSVRFGSLSRTPGACHNITLDGKVIYSVRVLGHEENRVTKTCMSL